MNSADFEVNSQERRSGRRCLAGEERLGGAATRLGVTVFGILSSLVALTKPTIVLSYALTGAAAMVVEGSVLANPARFILILLAITFTGAGANALNQYLEREIDAQMPRTAKKRPLPQGKISPNFALWFSILLCLLPLVYLVMCENLLSAALALGTILFYSFFYTLWLKPRTPYNIVIGGAAGATAPLIGWAAATGTLHWLPLWMFLIIFIWTPPHFWSLALCLQEQYAKVNMPMLPVVKGKEKTQKEIWWYSLALVPMTLFPIFVETPFGSVYISGAVILGFLWITLASKIRKNFSVKNSYRFFGYSVLYLMGLFILMMF